MSNNEVILELIDIKNTYTPSLKISSIRKVTALETAITALTSACSTCKFEDVEPWDSPCYDCSHKHKDYYTVK